MKNKIFDKTTHLFFTSTGMDALIAQLRDGSVTLRRNKYRRTNTNAALQEMFAVLEQSRNQNRSSKQLVDTDFRLVDIDIHSRTPTASTLTVPKKRIEITTDDDDDGGGGEDTIFV